jgi:AmmeMemoRadiSam system protein A
MLQHRIPEETAAGKTIRAGLPAMTSPSAFTASLSPADRRFLLQLARWSLKTCCLEHEAPQAVPAELPPAVKAHRACFVTLARAGKLRGCIGQLAGRHPLYQAVITNTRNAALHDPRFPAVEPREVDEIGIEISALTEAVPVAFQSPDELLSKLEPGRHGVILRIGGRTATFLPQVWEHIPGKEDFLNQLTRKAGCEPHVWKGPDVTVSVYETESFAEPPPT